MREADQQKSGAGSADLLLIRSSGNLVIWAETVFSGFNVYWIGVSQEVCWSGSYGLNREQATFLNVCSTVPVLVSACVTKAR